MAAQTIKITGARQHNLKNLTLEIPRERLVVITGMSGSGKTNLLFLLFELYAKSGIHVGLIDPMAIAWGLAFSATGKANDLPVVILGGDKADLPVVAGRARELIDWLGLAPHAQERGRQRLCPFLGEYRLDCTDRINSTQFARHCAGPRAIVRVTQNFAGSGGNQPGIRLAGGKVDPCPGMRDARGDFRLFL